jgi:hypothetical protein
MSLVPDRRLFVDDPADVREAAHALAEGAVVATAFGNFYVIVTRPDAATVRGVNLAKGRPVDQVGSITTAAPRIPGMYDWTRLSPLLDLERTRALMDALYARGPFGFRGPAADRVPDHLTMWDQGVRTTQVIAPGAACPANAFFDAAMAELGTDDILYITSANRSRHLTGAAEEPAHWKATGIAADFAHVPNFVVLEHRDEAVARARYAAYAPTSVTLLALHAPSLVDGRPVLTVDRHGSLHVDDVRRVAAPLGFGVELGRSAARRLQVRDYEAVYA